MCIQLAECGMERSKSDEEIAYADGYDERNQKFGVKSCKEAHPKKKHIFQSNVLKVNER